MSKKAKEVDLEQEEEREPEEPTVEEVIQDLLLRIESLEDRVDDLEKNQPVSPPTRDSHPELFDEFGNRK